MKEQKQWSKYQLLEKIWGPDVIRRYGGHQVSTGNSQTPDTGAPMWTDISSMNAEEIALDCGLKDCTCCKQYNGRSKIYENEGKQETSGNLSGTSSGKLSGKLSGSIDDLPSYSLSRAESKVEPRRSSFDDTYPSYNKESTMSSYSSKAKYEPYRRESSSLSTGVKRSNSLTEYDRKSFSSSKPEGNKSFKMYRQWKEDQNKDYQTSYTTSYKQDPAPSYTQDYNTPSYEQKPSPSRSIVQAVRDIRQSTSISYSRLRNRKSRTCTKPGDASSDTDDEEKKLSPGQRIKRLMSPGSPLDRLSRVERETGSGYVILKDFSGERGCKTKDNGYDSTDESYKDITSPSSTPDVVTSYTSDKYKDTDKTATYPEKKPTSYRKKSDITRKRSWEPTSRSAKMKKVTFSPTNEIEYFFDVEPSNYVISIPTSPIKQNPEKQPTGILKKNSGTKRRDSITSRTYNPTPNYRHSADFAGVTFDYSDDDDDDVNACTIHRNLKRRNSDTNVHRSSSPISYGIDAGSTSGISGLHRDSIAADDNPVVYPLDDDLSFRNTDRPSSPYTDLVFESTYSPFPEYKSGYQSEYSGNTSTYAPSNTNTYDASYTYTPDYTSSYDVKDYSDYRSSDYDGDYDSDYDADYRKVTSSQRDHCGSCGSFYPELTTSCDTNYNKSTSSPSNYGMHTTAVLHSAIYPPNQQVKTVCSSSPPSNVGSPHHHAVNQVGGHAGHTGHAGQVEGPAGGHKHVAVVVAPSLNYSSTFNSRRIDEMIGKTDERLMRRNSGNFSDWGTVDLFRHVHHR